MIPNKDEDNKKHAQITLGMSHFCVFFTPTKDQFATEEEAF